MNKPIEENLKIVLDFVERWNKLDTEQDVAQACVELEEDILIKPMATDYSDAMDAMFKNTTPDDFPQVKKQNKSI